MPLGSLKTKPTPFLSNRVVELRWRGSVVLFFSRIAAVIVRIAAGDISTDSREAKGKQVGNIFGK